MTDDSGAYRVALPLGTYRIGAYLTANAAEIVAGFWGATWVGDVYAIGMSKDVVVTGSLAGVDIAMVRAVRIAGRLVGRDGIGVPNAQITASASVGGIDSFAGGVTKTDANGFFTGRVVAMQLRLLALAAGRIETTSAIVDLDLTADRTDLIVTIDRGNIVTGILRDAQGKPIANTDFGVHPLDVQVPCGYTCNATTDASGHFAVTLPTTTVYFATWQDRVGAPLYKSKNIVVASDLTVDPVLIIQ